MTKVKIYVVNGKDIQEFDRDINDRMPYSEYLYVKEFKGSSKSNILWTDIKLLKTFDALRIAYGKPIPARYGFKRIWEGGHAKQSQHYAGLAVDMAQALTPNEREKVRKLARIIPGFGYIEPATLAPTWVHADVRKKSVSGYPTQRKGNINTYVFILQDALCRLGHKTAIDGKFGPKTEAILKEFQKKSKLTADGICGPRTWATITKKF